MLANLTNEAEAAARNGANEPLLRTGVADRTPSRTDSARQRVVRDTPSLPHGPNQLFLGHHVIVVLREVGQQIEHLRLDMHHRAVAAQLSPGAINCTVVEAQDHVAFLQQISRVPSGLVKVTELTWRDRVHFFAVAARVMRRILVDSARERAALKRGGDLVHLHESGAVDTVAARADRRSAEVCALEDALMKLSELDPRRAQVVELRFFGGLTVDETAEVLEVSPRTVAHDWQLARAWLLRELQL